MGKKRATKLQERPLECNFGEAWQIVTQAGRTMYAHFGGIVWETFIRHRKQMDKTLAFNEITPLPYCFKVLQTCFGLPEFDTEKSQSTSFVPESPANFRTTGYIGLSVLTFFFLGWSLWVQICFVWSWLRYICWNYFTILSLNVPSFRLDRRIPLPWPFQQIPMFHPRWKYL